LTSNESIKQAVIGNMGLAFLSLHTAGLELQSGVLCSLDVAGLPVIRSWYVVRLKSTALSDASESLRRFIIEFGGDVIERQFGGIQQRTTERRKAATTGAEGSQNSAVAWP
jgi:DNA-binding transcriptional LysR family regulator